ncbi:MAG TPA: hypothetical protein VK897_20555 [Anaerolineales bacterium]|nr:hypothetical protein [Anaerolineales bacterium]
MNNNLYHWHDERLVELKQREINREIEHLRLLKEAGLSEPGWLARAGRAIRNWLVMRTNRQQGADTVDYRSFQQRSDELPQ